MDKRSFVRIEVPTVDHSGRGQGGTAGASGTGYPVGENLILTARHVVRLGKERDRQYPIRVRWHSFPDSGEHSEGVVELDDDEEAIVWEGVGDIDIALLHCPQRPEPVQSGRFLHRLPRDGDHWKSIGFPRATHFAEGRFQNSFRGDIRVPDEAWFEICDEYSPRTADDWKGASGMPIFVDDRIVGVFSASLERITGKAHAIPIQPLFEIGSEFRKRVGYDDKLETEWRAYREAVAREVAEILEKASGTRQVLLRRVDCPAACRPEVQDRDACRHLADMLLEMEFRDFTALANDLYWKLRESDDGEEDKAAAQAMFQIAHRLVPALYDPGVVRIACEQRDSAALIELPAAMHTVAEFAVAAAEARAVQFRPRRETRDLDLLGARSLPAVVPELGIEATSEKISDATEDHFIRKLLLATSFKEKDFLKGMDDYMRDTFYPSGRPSRNHGKPDREDRDRWNGIDRELARWGHKSRFYLVFRPADDAELKTMKETAMELKDRYKHLMILFLVDYRVSGENLWDREADQVIDFCQMLPIRGTSTP